jgi:formylglycine-generating enzyme required for sulfatase activity
LQPAGKFVKLTPPPDVVTNKFGMKLIRIEPGTFSMGSPPKEFGRSSDEIQHKVVITKPFRMGSYPVTQGEYRRVMGKDPENLHFTAGGKYSTKLRGVERDNFPVEGLSLHEAQEFCETLSAKEKRKYRLPTEAEWEYACRAGTETAYSIGNQVKDPDRAWHAGNSGGRIHAVGEKDPNPWGLYDMHGNVMEYCQDRYDAKYHIGLVEPQIDPKGPTDSKSVENFVARGGGWDGKEPNGIRSAARTRIFPGVSSYDNTGFRIVLEIDEKEATKP